jgi:hypothetical protein
VFKVSFSRPGEQASTAELNKLIFAPSRTNGTAVALIAPPTRGGSPPAASLLDTPIDPDRSAPSVREYLVQVSKKKREAINNVRKKLSTGESTKSKSKSHQITFCMRHSGSGGKSISLPGCILLSYGAIFLAGWFSHANRRSPGKEGRDPPPSNYYAHLCVPSDQPLRKLYGDTCGGYRDSLSCLDVRTYCTYRPA